METPSTALLIGLGSLGAEVACRAASGLETEAPGLAGLVRVLTVKGRGLHALAPDAWATSGSSDAATESVPADGLAHQPGAGGAGAADHASGPPSDHDVPEGDPAGSSYARAGGVQNDGYEQVDGHEQVDGYEQVDGVPEPPAPPATAKGDADAGVPGVGARLLVEIDLAPGEAPADGPAAAERVRAVQPQLVRALAKELRELRDHSRTSEREREIGILEDQVSIILYVALHDPVGSPSLLPVLESLELMFRRVMTDFPRHVQVNLLFPDLAERLDASALPRAYATLRELDCTLELGHKGKNPVWVDRVWLFSARNAVDLFLRSSSELAGVMVGQLLATTTGLLGNDPSPVPVLQRSITGRRARYGTLGFARLVFPRAELVDAATNDAIASALLEMPALRPERAQRDELSAMVQRIVRNQPLTNLDDELRYTDEGTPIFTPFQPPPRPDEAFAREFGPALRARYEEFGRTAAPDALAGVARRSATVQTTVQRALDRAVLESLEPDEAARLAQAQALVAALLGDESSDSEGEASESTPTVPAAVESVFFGYFAPLFESDRFPEASAGGPRRERKQRLDRDLGTLRRQLERTREDLARRRGDAVVPASAAADAGANPATRERSAHSADVRANTAEMEERAELELESLRTREAELTARIAEMDAERAQLVIELDEIEAAVRSPVERRDLLERTQRARIEAIDRLFEQHEAAMEAVNPGYQAWRRLAKLANRWKLGLTGAVVLVAAGAAMRLELRFLAAAVAIASAAAFVAYWYYAGAALRLSYRRWQDAVTARDGIRRDLEESYRALAQSRFQHILYSQVAEWGDRICRYLREDLGNSLSQLRATLLARGTTARERAASVSFPPRSGVDYLLPQEGVSAAWEPYANEVHRAAEGVLHRWPVRELFERFRLAPEVLDVLEAELVAAAGPVLAPLATSSLDDFLISQYPDRPARQTRIAHFCRAASPMGRNAFPRSDEPTAELDLLRVAGPASQSLVARHVAEGGRTPRVLTDGSETEALLLRTSIGFAAFQFAGLYEAWDHFRAMDTGARLKLSTMLPAYGYLAPDLFPPVLGTAQHDEDLCLLVERALNKGAATAADAAIVFQGQRFESLDHWLAYLNEPRGFFMLQNLREVVTQQAGHSA